MKAPLPAVANVGGLAEGRILYSQVTGEESFIIFAHD